MLENYDPGKHHKIWAKLTMTFFGWYDYENLFLLLEVNPTFHQTFQKQLTSIKSNKKNWQQYDFVSLKLISFLLRSDKHLTVPQNSLYHWVLV